MFCRIKSQRNGKKNHQQKGFQCKGQSDRDLIRKKIRHRHVILVGTAHIPVQEAGEPAAVPDEHRIVQSHLFPECLDFGRIGLSTEDRECRIAGDQGKSHKNDKRNEKDRDDHADESADDSLHAILSSAASFISF
jgi:hypothetical protein